MKLMRSPKSFICVLFSSNVTIQINEPPVLSEPYFGNNDNNIIKDE